MNDALSRGPILTNDTTLDELQQLGAHRLSDVPLNELLEFVRQQLLSWVKDEVSCEEMGWGPDLADAAVAVQHAIELYERAVFGPRA